MSHPTRSVFSRRLPDRSWFFWQAWPLPDRISYLVAAAGLLTAVIWFVVQYIVGADAVIDWQTHANLQDVSLRLDAFTKGLFTFRTDAFTYAVQEQFTATPMAVNWLATYGTVAFWLLGVSLLLAVIPSLPRLWYVVSMGAFILWLASVKFDLLRVAGFTNSTVFIAAVAVFAGVSYYFHAFNTAVSVTVRWMSFLALALLFSGGIGYFAQAGIPSVSLLNYGIIVPVLLGILFTLFIGHEIVHGFLYLVTQSGSVRNTNSFLHFTLITAVYIANLALAYLHNSGSVTWDILYVDAFYVYLVSVIVGWWGFAKRQMATPSSALPFAPHGALLYVALATVSTATMAYFFATANDPMMEMLEDVILFVHLGMGVGFYLYVFINFFGPMQQGLAVHRVVYQPRRYPFFYTHGLAALVMLALLLQAKMFPFYQSIAGYYNGLGDVYAAQNERGLAEQYYKHAIQYEFQNHHSNYALASLALTQRDETNAAYYFKQALRKKPTVYAYANLGYLYADQRLMFESMFTLRDGIRRFPRSGELKNNLALLFQQANVADSAFIYLDAAQSQTSQPDVVHTNWLAFWAQNDSLLISADSLLQEIPASEHLPLQTNRLVLANLRGNTDESAFAQRRDSVLTPSQFAYVFNYAVNHKNQPDSTLNAHLLAYETHPANSVYAEDVQFVRALHEYYGNRKKEAFNILAATAANSPRERFFNKILGLWWLHENVYPRAGNYFASAVAAGDSSLLTNQAVARSEAQQWTDAVPVWQYLADSADADTRNTAQAMLAVARIRQGNTAGRDTLDDAGKALLVHFSPDTPLMEVATQIQDTEYRARALADVADYSLRNGNISAAEAALQTVRQVSEWQPATQWRINDLQLQLLLAQKKHPDVLAALDKASLGPDSDDRKTYFRAVCYAHTGKAAQARPLFDRAVDRFPVAPDVVAAASQFYHAQLKNDDRSYAILVDAITLDPYSPDLLKAYILQSLELYLFDYAAEAMTKLRDLTPPADYQAFQPKYEAKKALVEKRVPDWQ